MAALQPPWVNFANRPEIYFGAGCNAVFGAFGALIGMI